jgi:hypothetical protein
VSDCSGEVNLEKNVHPGDTLGTRCAFILCRFPFACLQLRDDAGQGFSPSPRVQVQKLGVRSVFVFSGNSLRMCPPPHHAHRGDCLQLAQIFGSCSTE